MTTVTGVISVLRESSARHGMRYSVNVDGAWYDQFAKAFVAKEGDTVELQVEEDPSGTYNPKIRRIRVLGSGASTVPGYTPPGPKVVPMKDDRNIQIMRQNAVTNANSFLQHNEESYGIQELIETAEVLVNWYTGEITAEEVTALANAEDATFDVEGVKAAHEALKERLG